MKTKKFIVLMSLLAVAFVPAANAQNDKNSTQKAAETPDFYDSRRNADNKKADALEVHRDSLLHANTDTLMKHIRILASSEYEGRVAGSQAYIDAANYCAGVLASYGVKPLDDEWAQWFEVELNEVENCNFHTYVNDNDTRIRYVLGRDYICASMTGRGYVAAPVVFCGYGIDDRSYDEYGPVDVQGKIVLCLTGVPDFLPSKVTDRYATLRDKAAVARKHGAVGLVAINVSETCRPNEVQHFAYCGEGKHMPTFPMVQPTMEMGNALLADEQMTLDSVMEVLASTRKPSSFHLRKSFEININAKYHPSSPTCNVVGVLPGHDERMKNEYVVVGAHLDHVGKQGATCIFPGADDDASGVAALLETARLLTTMAPDSIEYTKRPILFVLFSGGELQHLGSRIFVDNFPKLKNVECFIGAECIGAGDSINVLGNKRFPDLWNIALHNDTIGANRMVRSMRTLPKGDALPFARVGIPSLVFTHFQGNHHDHVPSDISENIEREILTKNASLMAQVIYELALGDYQGRSFRSKRFQQE